MVRLLFIDGLNYASSFFPPKNQWKHPITALKKVEKFVEGLRRDGWYLEVFLDAATQTEEARQKWTSRREKEVTKCERKVPQGANVMLGEMFRHFGVKVHYSLDADNDDTLIAHAVAKNAYILSADKDMYRYIYAGKQVTVFPGFTQKGRKTELHPPKPKEFVGEKRNLILPPPKTSDRDPSFVRLAQDMKYVRGTPSPLTRYFGNLHLKVRPLRQALYSKLLITEPVLEIFPEWDENENKVKWIEETVLPDPTFLHFFQIGRLEDAFKTFIAEKDVVRPLEHDPILWHNHLYAMWTTIAELISVGTHQPLFSLLLESPAFNSHVPPPPPVQNNQNNNPRNSNYSKNNSRNRRYPNNRYPMYHTNKEQLDSSMKNLKL